MTYLSNTQRVAEQYAANHRDATDEYTLDQYGADASDNNLRDALDAVMDILAEFDAKLTDADVDMESLQPAAAVLWMERYEGDFEFVLDVRARWNRWGSLRVGTLRGLLNCMRAEARRRPAPEPEALPFAEGETYVAPAPAAGSLRPIVDLLATARANTPAGKKSPRLTVTTPETGKVTVKFAPESGRNAGWLYVYQNDGYAGKVSPEGVPALTASTQALVALLNEVAADPTGYAVRYGRLTVHCMFCGRQLDTKASRHVGYGPVCADTYGLPWGATE